jgi:hypothetical protein
MGHSLENLALALLYSFPMIGSTFAANIASRGERHAYPGEILPEGILDSSSPITTADRLKQINTRNGFSPVQDRQ